VLLHDRKEGAGKLTLIAEETPATGAFNPHAPSSQPAQ